MIGFEDIGPVSESSVLIDGLIDRDPRGAFRSTGLVAACSILGLSARGAWGAFGFGLGVEALAGRERFIVSVAIARLRCCFFAFLESGDLLCACSLSTSISAASFSAPYRSPGEFVQMI